jgi:peptidoglycan-associated lipoprotein
MPKYKIALWSVILLSLTLCLTACPKKPAEMPAEAPPEVSAVTEIPEEPPAIMEETVDEAAAARAAAEADAAAARAAAEDAARRATSGLQRIQFDFDQYVLTDAAMATLAQNAELLKAAPSVRVQIEGHCDERGSDEYNLALGEKRALTTKNYLASLGVDPSRLSIISYGEEVPLDPTHDEAAWAKNRRAEFKAQR